MIRFGGRFAPISFFGPALLAAWAFSIAYEASAQSTFRGDLTRLLPAEVESVVYIRDARALVEKLRASAFSDFYAEERGDGFLGPMSSVIEDGSREIAGLFGANPERWLDRLSGGIVLARLTPPKGGKNGATILIHEHRGDPDEIALRAAPSPRRGVRIDRTRARYGPYHYTVIRSTRETYEEVGGGKRRAKGSPRPIAGLRSPKVRRTTTTEEHLYVDESLVIRASGPGFPIRLALDRLRAPGKHPTLTDAPRRRGALAALDSAAPDIEIYIDLLGLSRVGKRRADENLFGRGVDWDRLGVDEIKSAAIGLSFEADRLSADLALYVPPPRRGVGRLLFMNEPINGSTGAGHSAPAALPADAIGYSIFAADLGPIWSEFRRTLREGAPDLAAVLEALFQAFDQGGGVDLEEDFFANLGGRWMTFTRVPAARRSRRPKPETTLVLEVRDVERLGRSLERWLADFALTMNFTLDRGSIGPWTNYRLIGAETTAGALLPLSQLANVCLTDRWLYLSPKAEHIAASLAALEAGPGTQGLASSDDYRRSIDHLAAGRFYELYFSPDGYAPLFESPWMRLFTGLTGGLGGGMLDLDRAPDPEVWKRYFGPMAASAVSLGDAIRVEFDLLYAPEPEVSEVSEDTPDEPAD